MFDMWGSVLRLEGMTIKNNTVELMEKAVAMSSDKMGAIHAFRKMQWARDRGTHMGHFEAISELWEKRGNKND
tara:strand:+ start:186 stop:404 length:219 start_codon:yes stop_codon:yes gene_type:complete